MNENILGLLGGIALAVVLGFFLMKRQKAKAAESWDAVITKVKRRNVQRDQDAPMESYIRAEYQRSDGKRGSFELPEGQFEQHYRGLKEGDRLSKPAGEWLPRRL